MFKGLDDESECDLEVTRLNAYRAHFGLQNCDYEKSGYEVKSEPFGGSEVVEEVLEERVEEIIGSEGMEIVDEEVKFFLKISLANFPLKKLP